MAIAAWTIVALLVLSIVPHDRLSASSVSPILIVCGLAVIYGIIVPIQLLHTQKTYLLSIDYSPWFWHASTMSALAAMAFCVGYAICRRGIGTASGDPVPETHAPVDTAPALDRLGRRLGCLAVALFAYRVAKYGLGGRAIRLGTDTSAQEGATAYITYAPQYLAGIVLYLWHRSPNRLMRRLSGAACFFLVFYFFASGVRYLVIVMIAALTLLFYWRRAKRLLPPLRYLLFAAVIGYLILGFAGQLRTASVYGASVGRQQAARDSFEISLPLAALVSHTERTGFVFGTSYTYVAYQVIPRSIWPGKPLAPTLLAVAAFTDVNEGRAIPLWGELFLNFGWYGVAFGMALFGYLMHRWIVYWLHHRERCLPLDVISALVIALIVQWVSRGFFVQLVYNTFGVLLGPCILLWYDRVLRRRARPLLHRPSADVTAPTISDSVPA